MTKEMSPWALSPTPSTKNDNIYTRYSHSYKDFPISGLGIQNLEAGALKT